MPVARWAHSYRGIPYNDAPRGRAGGDCWNLVRLVYQERFRIELPAYADRYQDAAERKEVARLVREERGAWDEVTPGAERVGDVVILRVPGEDAPAHVGVVVGEGMMLDAQRGAGVLLESYRTGFWAGRVDGFVRHERRRVRA